MVVAVVVAAAGAVVGVVAAGEAGVAGGHRWVEWGLVCLCHSVDLLWAPVARADRDSLLSNSRQDRNKDGEVAISLESLNVKIIKRMLRLRRPKRKIICTTCFSGEASSKVIREVHKHKKMEKIWNGNLKNFV